MKRLAEILCEDNEDAKKKIGGAIMGGTAWKTLGERIEEAEQEIADRENISLEEVCEILELDLIVEGK